MMEESPNTERAVSMLREAISGFDAANMALYAAASRRMPRGAPRRRRGRDLVRGAEAVDDLRVDQEPARMTAMLAPGFSRAHGA